MHSGRVRIQVLIFDVLIFDTSNTTVSLRAFWPGACFMRGVEGPDNMAGEQLWHHGFVLWESSEQVAVDWIEHLSNDDVQALYAYKPWQSWSEAVVKYIVWMGSIVFDMAAEQGACALDDMPFAGELSGGGASDTENAFRMLRKLLGEYGVTLPAGGESGARDAAGLEAYRIWKAQVVVRISAVRESC